jgi:hypothetical protein
LLVDKHHIEVVQLYKERIFSLEVELEMARQDKYKSEQMLFKHLGLLRENEKESEFQQISNRPMSPGRIKNMLETQSRNKANKGTVND